MPVTPERIVSLSASNTEIIAALGLTRRLVGVDNWSDYPPAVRQLPKVGRDLDIDVDAVAQLKPDLVVACLSVPGMERNIPRLAAVGLPYIALKPVGLDTIYENIRLAGEATGRSRRAQRLVTTLQKRLDDVRCQIAGAQSRPRVYWEWYPKPFVSAGGRSWMTELITLAGGDNIFADRDGESAKIDAAEVIDRDPDVVVACWCGARRLPRVERIAGRPGWEEVSAMRSGRVHVVPEALFGRPGPRLADGLDLLARLLHPEITKTPVEVAHNG